MTISVIKTEQAPAAVGPYSQAIRLSHMFPAGEGHEIYTSGQLGLDPATGQLVAGGVEAEARQAFKNLQAVAEEAGATLGNAIKLTLYLTDLSQFAAVNAIMKEMVPEPYPARTTIGVAALPLGGRFEIEGVFAV